MKFLAILFTALLLLVLGGCHSHPKLALTPEDHVFCVDTRLVFLDPNHTKQDVDEMKWALAAAESCFKEFRLHFVVTSVCTYDLSSRGADFESMSLESTCYSNQLSVYLWPESKLISGMATLPSMRGDNIVALYGKNSQKPDILVHELGHWLGLKHSFELDDTEITDIDHKQAEKDGLCDKNYMGYGFAIDWWDKSFTCQQYDKMLFTLSAYRNNCVITRAKNSESKSH